MNSSMPQNAQNRRCFFAASIENPRKSSSAEILKHAAEYILNDRPTMHFLEDFLDPTGDTCIEYNKSKSVYSDSVNRNCSRVLSEEDDSKNPQLNTKLIVKILTHGQISIYGNIADFKRNADKEIMMLAIHSSSCTFCKSKSKKLSACSACGRAQYCNRRCQISDWKRHKCQECRKP